MKEDYKDIDGNPCTLEKLCRTEPAWACSRIRHDRSAMVTLAESHEKYRLALAMAESEIKHLRGLERELDGAHREIHRLKDGITAAIRSPDRAWLIASLRALRDRKPWTCCRCNQLYTTKAHTRSLAVCDDCIKAMYPGEDT